MNDSRLIAPVRVRIFLLSSSVGQTQPVRMPASVEMEMLREINPLWLFSCTVLRNIASCVSVCGTASGR